MAARCASEQRHRVYLAAPAPDFEVKVGSGDAPRCSAQAENMAGPDSLPFGHADLREVCVDREQASTVVQPYDASEAAHDPGESHARLRHRADGCTRRNVQVDAAMNVGPDAEEAEAEAGGDWGLDRPAREVTARKDQQRQKG